MEKPDTTAVLNAENLEAWEDDASEAIALEGRLQPADQKDAFNMQAAAEHVRRLRYHNQKDAEEKAEAEAMMAPLLAEIERIREWQAVRAEYRTRRINAHQMWFQGYYFFNKPVDGKHLDLPGARIQAKQPSDKWNYGDEKVLADLLKDQNCGALLRFKPEVKKDELKANAFFQDGRWYVPNMDGEAIELPITVSKPPVEYTIKLTEPKAKGA